MIATAFTDAWTWPSGHGCLTSRRAVSETSSTPDRRAYRGHRSRRRVPGRLALAELNGVMIETNDSGPFGADVWWLLFGADDRVAVAFPQGAAGEQAAIDWLAGLPGFDHDAMIMAMGSTANAVFPVWRRASRGREICDYACKAAWPSRSAAPSPTTRSRPPVLAA